MLRVIYLTFRFYIEIYVMIDSFVLNLFTTSTNHQFVFAAVERFFL